MDSINNFKSLIKAIENTNDFVILKIQKQINVAMTLRNQIIGWHIVEHEQKGEVLAIYGKQVIEMPSDHLKS